MTELVKIGIGIVFSIPFVFLYVHILDKATKDD